MKNGDSAKALFLGFLVPEYGFSAFAETTLNIGALGLPGAPSESKSCTSRLAAIDTAIEMNLQ